MRLQERIDTLERELERLRALLEAQVGAKSPPPPPPSPPKPEEPERVRLEDLTGFYTTPRMVAQAAALLGFWPEGCGGTLAFTPEEAKRISALLAAYHQRGAWGKALEALGLAPPPPAASLARLLLLGEAAREHARALSRALEGSDLNPVARDGAVATLRSLGGPAP